MDLLMWVKGHLLGIGMHWDLLLGWQHLLVRVSRGHLLVGRVHVGLGYRGHGLGRGGHLRVGTMRKHLTLGRPWHGTRHHLGLLLGSVALLGMIALGHLRLWLVAMLGVWLGLTRECLLILRRHTRSLLWGHVPMWVPLLSRDRGARARRCPRGSLVALGLGVLLLLLGWRDLGRPLHGHPWLGHEVWVGPHLWGYCVAGGDCWWHRVEWGGGIAGNRGMDAVYGGGGRTDRGRGHSSRLGGLRRGWPVP